MLSAIDFNHEPALEADKIQNVWPERNLPSKLDAVQSAIS